MKDFIPLILLQDAGVRRLTSRNIYLAFPDFPGLDYPIYSDTESYHLGLAVNCNKGKCGYTEESDGTIKIKTYYRSDNDTNKKAFEFLGIPIIEYHSTKNPFRSCYIKVPQNFFDCSNTSSGIYTCADAGELPESFLIISKELATNLSEVGFTALADLLRDNVAYQEQFNTYVTNRFDGSWYGYGDKKTEISFSVKQWVDQGVNGVKAWRFASWQDHVTINEINNLFKGYIRTGGPVHREKKTLHLQRHIADFNNPDGPIRIAVKEAGEKVWIEVDDIK